MSDELASSLAVVAEHRQVDLDEAVYEAKSDEAATINNSGIQEQCAYLLEHYGYQHALAIVKGA